MKDYGSDKIRSVGFFGHGGCGKTTLCDTLLYLLKQNSRIGRVDEGNSLLDYDEDEISRKISINLALGYGEHRDTLLNIVDTPGYADFVGDVYREWIRVQPVQHIRDDMKFASADELRDLALDVGAVGADHRGRGRRGSGRDRGRRAGRPRDDDGALRRRGSVRAHRPVGAGLQCDGERA